MLNIQQVERILLRDQENRKIRMAIINTIICKDMLLQTKVSIHTKSEMFQISIAANNIYIPEVTVW